MRRMKPNIFDYATSELSQDAFWGWLFKWAEKDNAQFDEHLCKCAKECLLMFLGNTSLLNIENVEIYRQWENIDLWITVNNDYHIIIEDKIGTSEHDNQLERYKKIAKEWYENEGKQDFDTHFSFVYYKIGDITPYERNIVEKAEYKLIDREQVLSIFEKYEISNSLFNDYKEKIKSIQKLQDSIFNISFDEILKMDDKDAYVKSFYINLSPKLGESDWGYVNNPNKSFYGMWWYWCSWTYGTFYFQFNEFELYIRICDVKNTNTPQDARNIAHEKVINAANKNDRFKGKIEKPTRFGVGNSMAIAKINQDLWLSTDENGFLDISKIFEKLHTLEKFLWSEVLQNEEL